MPASPESEQSEQEPLQRPAEPDLANKGHDCPQQHERACGQGNDSYQIGFLLSLWVGAKKDPTVLASARRWGAGDANDCYRFTNLICRESRVFLAQSNNDLVRRLAAS
jgi:hypothetical protein